ncbi:terpenoid synthase [Fistulina hepatica ATCC 64428]|uniref:Terpenoid synthase n=1 Tax=Fistulina hepatica ATCC 64428 TaxID=1128425 RepID=A0A0D7AM14_9AGAR|nr:terpenoid synthase [Fistulina hepatica ATCC 64428]
MSGSIPAFHLSRLTNLASSLNFELRVNRHCHAVSAASIEWVIGMGGDTDGIDHERGRPLESMKVGLWASMMFPASDYPQLRLLSDFLHVLTLSDRGLLRSEHATCTVFDDLFESSMFRILKTRLMHVCSTAPTCWQARFCASIHAYQFARLQVESDTDGASPDITLFPDVCRDSSGIEMTISLFEALDGLFLSNESLHEDVATLRRCAANIIAWSMHVASYNVDQAEGRTTNLVSVLMRQHGLDLQSGIDHALQMVSRELDAFHACEMRFLSGVSKNSSSSTTRSYIQALKSCICGTLNWLYETELFFGMKAEMVRRFGWVFLLPPRDGV